MPAQRAAQPGRHEPDDATLVGLLGKADPDALAVLYQRHGTACYQLARQVTANSTLAEDAVQEAFTGIWLNPSAYLPDRGSVRNWLLRLTRHKAIDLVRRENTQQQRQHAQAAQHALDPPAAGEPYTAAWEGIRAQQVRAALAGLPQAQRHTLALAYYGGYTQREIADLTRVPVGTVKSRVSRAMEQLQLRLVELGGEEPS